MTVKEVSEKLDIPEHVIYYEIERGGISRHKFGYFVMVDEDGIEYLKNKEKAKEGLLTPKEYCKKYKIKRGKFNYNVLKGYIKAIKIGGKVFVKEFTKGN